MADPDATPTMARIVIVIEGGLVQSVFSDLAGIEVEVFDRRGTPDARAEIDREQFPHEVY